MLKQPLLTKRFCKLKVRDEIIQFKGKTKSQNEQIIQLSSELSQLSEDCAMSSSKIIELQTEHANAVKAAEDATAQLNAKLIEHEKFRFVIQRSLAVY